jgi:hypothetical protein
MIDIEKNESEMFVPNYASVSNICIDNQITCIEAIKILLEKYQVLYLISYFTYFIFYKLNFDYYMNKQITEPPEKFSLYKVYHTGEKKELKDDDIPLIIRLFMGPFDEEKIFIMEKGRQINMNEELATLVSLPDSLLVGLIESCKLEEQKEIEILKKRYEFYRNILNERLEHFENPNSFQTFL